MRLALSRPGDGTDPSAGRRLMSAAEPPMQARREWGEISRAEAVSAIEDMDEDDDLDVEAFIDDFAERADQVKGVFQYVGIDGWGFEIEVDSGAGFVTSFDFQPRGICMLSITNSKFEDQVPGPHFIAYSSTSIGFGPKASAGGGLTVGSFIARYFGEPDVPPDERPITAESYAGGTVSLDVDGDIPISNVGGGISVFGSQDQGLFGLTNFLADEYEPGWQGIASSVSIGPGMGGGFSVSVGYTYGGTLDETLQAAYGRQDVREAMEEMEDMEISEEGEFHHPHDSTIVPSWLSTGIGERMQE